MKAGLPNQKMKAQALCPHSEKLRAVLPAIFLIVFLLIAPQIVFAPSSQYPATSKMIISSVSLVEQDTANNLVTVQFNISWGNSWRNELNWDAAWIFIKYTTETSAPYTWKHATLYKSATGTETNLSSYSQGSGTELDIVLPADVNTVPYGAHGAFVYRSDIGYGDVSTTSMQFVWEYGTDGVSDSASAKVKVYGIEMAYIPQASFYIGDSTNSGSNPPGGFVNGGDASYTAHLVNSDSQRTLGAASTGKVQSRSGMTAQDDFSSAATKSLPNNFPAGYSAFYVMKHEINQNQYAEFLNTIERKAQTNRVASTISTDSIPNYYVMSAESQLSRSNRNTITAPVGSNGSVNPVTFSADYGSRAMNYMSWMDLAAFADWAGLRPMNELEFEKAARGDFGTSVNYPAPGEYAWGSTYLSNTTYLGGDDTGTENEVSAPTDGNVNYGSVNYRDSELDNSLGTGPIRVGAYASNSSRATRPITGAGFYGVMNLSGNAAEQVVMIGNTTASSIVGGREFTVDNGDGILESGSLCANAGNSVGEGTWPGYNGNTGTDTNCVVTGGTNKTVQSAYGSMRRGGNWSDNSAMLRTSDRYDSSSLEGATRSSKNGGRLVRSAP